MEYPHGHPARSHHHRDHDRREEEYPPPAPPTFYGGPPPPPPPSSYYEPPPPPQANPHVYHSSHHVGGGGGGAYPAPIMSDYHSPQVPPPQPHNFNYSAAHGYPPHPETDYSSSGSSPVVVQHVSHQSETETNPHHYRPHMPSFLHHHHQQGSELAAGKPTVRLLSKAETNFSLTIRDGKVILAHSNAADPFQHWIKDEKFSTRVKDEEGFPSFALVNKATGQAIKHSIGATHPVQLIPYNPDVLDESVLWTQSKDLGDGYRTIRMVNNIRLNVDAFNGDKNHGGVKDGTTIVLWEWKKGDNQRWKIVSFCKSLKLQNVKK